MRKNLKLSSDGGDFGRKKCKRGCGGAYGGVWRSLRLAGIWSKAVCFVLVRLAGISFAVKMFSHLIYLKRNVINFVLSMQFAKVMLQLSPSVV
jgi:hypothetical protein